MISEVIKLRRELHRFPELSGQEIDTAKRIKTFLLEQSDVVLFEQIGGNGLAALVDFGIGGKTVAIRCELDALPIREENQLDYKSKIQGVSHKCGHDGHMAIVAGLLFWLNEQQYQSGKVVLLFQAAEETGKGAESMLSDERFAGLEIDYIFALHNIPAYPKNQIIKLENGFSAEVQSFSLLLSGQESHAAQPENGKNPSLAIAKLITLYADLQVVDPNDDKFAILTPVFTKIGERAYGISPGSGELHYTIRTWSKEEMELLVKRIETIAERIADKFQLEFDLEWFEHFPASVNDEDCNLLVEKSAHDLGLNFVQRQHPFRFGEDFGWFSKKYKTAMFGIGAGLSTPPLHNPLYDFPDDLLETGIAMFTKIIKNILDEE